MNTEHILALLRERERISAELAEYGIDRDGNMNMDSLPSEDMMGSILSVPAPMNELRLNMESKPPGWLDRNDDLIRRIDP